MGAGVAAAGGGSAWGRAGRSGAGCPRRTTTSSSRSSARSSGWSARSPCSALFAMLGDRAVPPRRSPADDVFVKIATGGVLAWVLGQALVNIGAVVGLLPVVGVPLPLVSSGGSALVTTLIALGMVLGFARRVPGAAEALASRPSVVRRSLAVLPGRRNGGSGVSCGSIVSRLSVVLAGGGSTGHVAPLLALADCLRRRDPDVRVTALGTGGGPRGPAGARGRATPSPSCPRVPLPRRPSADLGRLPWRLRPAVAAASRAMEEAPAQVVVGFGGYVSTPAYLAARRLGLPIVVHEQNARPGLANRLGARFTPLRRHHLPGHAAARRTGARHAAAARRSPTLDRAARRDEALAPFGLERGRTTLLVFGGSLGAQRLNVTFGRSRAALAEAGVQVLHVTGRGKAVEGLPSRRRAAARWPALRGGRVPRPDGPRLRRGRRRGLPGGRRHRLRADHGRAPRGVRAAPDRQRGAAAQRRARGRGRRRPARRRRAVHPAVGARHAAARCSPTTPSSPRWPRPRPPSGSRTATSGSPTSSRSAAAEARPGGPEHLVKPDLALDVPPAEALGRVHFIGIGGVGMAGLARIMLARGVPVSGSDAKASATTDDAEVAGRHRAHRSRPGPPGRRRQRRRDHRRARRQPRARRGPPARACSSCTARRRSPR